ncbi:hypothetical protein JCM16303_001676 [Sporobolomyces ruberrimus]
MEESPLAFVERWTASLRKLETSLGQPSFDPTIAKSELQSLGAELTEQASELPSYEVGRCERALKTVTEKVNEKKTKSVPKTKFSFKRTTPASSASAASPPVKAPTLRNATRTSSSSIELPSTSLTISSRSKEYLSISSLPSTTSSHPEALLLQDLSNCFVDLLSPNNASPSPSSSSSTPTFPAIYLSNLRDCSVLLPKIEGSVMIHDCHDCRLVLGGHQFRMHNSKNCSVYLEAGSTPIIEGCQGLVFDRYPELFQPAFRSASSLPRTVAFVQDFDYPFATTGNPSPNWTFANEGDKADSPPPAQLVMSLPLLLLFYISTLRRLILIRRQLPRASRFTRLCRAPNFLRSPRPRPPHPPQAPLSHPDLFPPHAPLGYFHSTQQMSGIARFRTPTQLAQISHVPRMTYEGAAREWWPRFGRRIAQEEKAAKEWRERPWRWEDAVGPYQAGRVVEEEARNPFWEEQNESMREGKEAEKGRNGAVPRPSAPAYRRKPTRTRTCIFRSTFDPSRSLHTGSFASIPISTPFKLAPSSDSTFARLYSTQTLARKNVLRARFPQDKKIDLLQIMNDLRDLELLELLKGVRPKSAVGFKDAHRALYPLYHRLDQKEIPHATFGDLDAALPELFSGAWTTIEQRLLEKRVAKLEALTKNEKAMLNLVALHSIGAKRAEVFVANGCKSAQDLLKADKKGTIKLSKAQKIGLVHREDFDRLIPREEMEKLKSALEDALKEVDPKFECEILGSYRRGVGFSSDIDLAVRHKSFTDKDDEETSKPLIDSIVARLEEEGLIERDNQLMLGPKKYAGLMKLPEHRHYRRIDIRLAPYPSYPYMLLGTTGDALLMKLMRHTAKKKGWCLNEFGMGEKYDAEDENPNGFRPGTMKIVKSEKEIFELLGFPFLRPEEREFSIWKGIFAKAGIPGLDQLHRL